MRAETIHVAQKYSTRLRLNRTRRGAVVLILAMFVTAPAASQGDPTDASLDPVLRFDPAMYSVGWLTSDRDNNGTVDYAVRVDDRGFRVREAMDFNFDGLMDDFYFYENNVLQRQEVDSNFDQEIDIWIYIWRGVFVRRWERDIDFDGAVDISRDYEQPR